MCCWTNPGGITKTSMVFLTMFEHHNYGDITDEWWLVDEYDYNLSFKTDGGWLMINKESNQQMNCFFTYQTYF